LISIEKNIRPTAIDCRSTRRLLVRTASHEGDSMQGIQTSTISLDWSRLLVFDQAPTTVVDAVLAAKLTDPRLAKLGIKPVKQGFKPIK